MDCLQKKPKVLVIDHTHPILEELLSQAGIICDNHPEYNREEVIRHLGEYDGIVVRSKITIDRTVIDAGKLKFIARTGAGMDAIDTAYAEQKGIVCLNSPEGNRDAVGEHALGMLLALFNKLCTGNNEVRTGLWKREPNRGLEIKGKTIGIIGYGNMGNAFAQRLSGFECKVLAYDKYKSNYGNAYAAAADMQQLFMETDILSLHLPLTPETYHLVDSHFLSLFKKNIYVINTSRGKVVDTNALAHAVSTGKVLGACLDVLEQETFSCEWNNENLPSSLRYLLNSDKTIFSPHVAGWTEESKYKLPYFLAKKITAILGK